MVRSLRHPKKHGLLGIRYMLFFMFIKYKSSKICEMASEAILWFPQSRANMWNCTRKNTHTLLFQYWLLLFKLLISVSHRLPQTSQAVAIVLGYPPELDGKTSLLKNPHNSVREHIDITMALMWKLCPYWLPFRVPEGCIHATWQ